MIMQGLLVTMLLVLALYAFLQRKRTPAVSIALLAGTVAGILLVLFPEASIIVAAWAGVGRGADLILYLFIVLTLATVFNLHLKIRANNELSTELARAIALQSAQPPEE